MVDCCCSCYILEGFFVIAAVADFVMTSFIYVDDYSVVERIFYYYFLFHVHCNERVIMKQVRKNTWIFINNLVI